MNKIVLWILAGGNLAGMKQAVEKAALSTFLGGEARTVRPYRPTEAIKVQVQPAVVQ
jgi:hypothetical protein